MSARFTLGLERLTVFGDGAIGLGPNRRTDPDNLPEARIARNSPALFNLGTKDFTTLSHDGRLEVDPTQPSGIRTPMDADMLDGFTSILSAQAMFPVLSRDEMAAPQFGPGKSATFEDHQRDDGRFRVTGHEEDRYAFRTPSLRNVALTAPYGHAGSHRDLARFVADHSDPAQSLTRYDRAQAILPGSSQRRPFYWSRL